MSRHTVRRAQTWAELSTLRREVRLLGGQCTSLAELEAKYQDKVYLNVTVYPKSRLRSIQLRRQNGKWLVWKVFGRTDLDEPDPLDNLDEVEAAFWKLWREIDGEERQAVGRI